MSSKKKIAHSVQEEGADKGSPFQAPLETVSCIAVQEARRWGFRRGLTRGVEHNKWGNQEDRQRPGAEHTEA